MAVQCQARRTKRIAKPHKCTTPQADLPMHKIHLTTVGVHSNDADHHRFRKLKSRNHRHLCISRLCRPTDRTARRRTKLKPKPNETRRTSCSGRGLHCVSCAICASSCPCTLEETGGTLISPGSPLNPRLRSSQNLHKKKTSTKLPRRFLFPLQELCGAPAEHSDVLSRLRCSPNTSPIQMP